MSEYDPERVREDIETLSRAALTPARRFDPVFLPEGRGLNGRMAQTFLRHANACMRSGFLYAKYRGEASTVEMQRGRAVHAILERSTRTLLDVDEPTIPPEVVKAVVNEVLAEVPVPLEEHDYIREASYRWASEWAVEPSAVVACETLFVLRVGDVDVRCRVDFAELRDGGATLYVADHKSGRGAPTQEDVARLRSDGTLHAKSFQLVLYALALVFGVPVREEEECPECRGNCVYTSATGHERNCGFCHGRGIVEVPEPFPVAARAQHLNLEFVFPGIEDREGKMLRRPLTLTRLELEEYRSSLGALVARVAEAERTGDWPAVVSDAACSECPASVECPIPAQLRDHRGTINTLEQFDEAAQKLDREKAEHRARQTELRNMVKAHGGSLRAGGKVWELVYSESESVTDKEGLFDAIERAVNYGEPFDRARFVRAKGRTDLKARDLTAQEREEERDGDGDAAGNLDERFGADAPF